MPLLLSWLLSASLAVSGAASSLSESSTLVALDNATLIDGTGAPARSGMTIVIDDDRIAAVGSTDSMRLPGDARRIDLHGRFVLPGFIDTHVHAVWGALEAQTVDGVKTMALEHDDDLARYVLRTLPSYGITTIGNPAAPTAPGIALREAVAHGQLFGPQIVTAGAAIGVIPSPGLIATVETADDVRAEIRRQAAAGVDFVKLYAGLPPLLARAGIEAAHANGLSAVGHLFATDWKTAADMGIDGIVHTLPGSAALLPPEQRQPYLGSITGTQFMYQWFEHADYDHPAMQAAIDAMAEHHVHHDPTLVAIEGMFFGNDPRVTDATGMDAVPDLLKQGWHGPFGLTHAWSDRDFERAQRVWPKVLDLVRRLYDAGVTLTAGTDTANPNVIPGRSFHRELELLVASGIPPAEVVRIATLNGAIALGLDSEIGTVAVGKQADLVVLAADPLADIGNTRRIVRVFMNGREVKPYVASTAGAVR